MNIDLSLMPTTFDAVHVGLAAALVALLILQILFLTIAFIAVFRKHESATPRPAEKPAEPILPAERTAVAEAKPAPAKTETVVVKEASPDSALQLLGLLQKEARFIDFTQEDVSHYSDADIGAAARVVHEGCRKVLRQHFDLEPVRAEAEGKRITLPKGFDAASIRLTGNIVGQPPFTGALVHRGWKATDVRLPKITEGHDVKIIAAAEVEL